MTKSSSPLPSERQRRQQRRNALPGGNDAPSRALGPEDAGRDEAGQRQGEEGPVLLVGGEAVVDADADDGDGEAVEGRQRRVRQLLGRQGLARREQVADAVVERADAEGVDGEGGDAGHFGVFS